MPLWWSCPAGAIEPGEDPVDAAIREAAEEAALVGPYMIVMQLVEPRQPFHHFIALVDRELPVRLNWESCAYGWFPIDALPEPLHPGWAEVLPYLADVVGYQRAPD